MFESTFERSSMLDRVTIHPHPTFNRTGRMRTEGTYLCKVDFLGSQQRHVDRLYAKGKGE